MRERTAQNTARVVAFFSPPKLALPMDGPELFAPKVPLNRGTQTQIQFRKAAIAFVALSLKHAANTETAVWILARARKVLGPLTRIHHIESAELPKTIAG